MSNLEINEKSIAILDLMEEVRTKGLPRDWALQRESGIRKRGFSRLSFDSELYSSRPEIENKEFLKKVYIYHRHNKLEKPEREIESSKVIIFLNFLFQDLDNKVGWPHTIRVFKEFKNGRYYEMIKGFEANHEQGYSVSRDERERAGATLGESATTQLLQLAIKANVETKIMKEEINRLTELNKQKQEDFKELREKIQKIETLLLQKGGDQSGIRRELDDLKQKIG